MAVVTACVWFAVSYASPCAPLPSQARLMQPVRCTQHHCPTQETLKHLTVSDLDEELYGGGGLYQESHRFFPQLWCPDGQYSSYGQLFFTPMTEALRIIMHMGEPLPEQQVYEFSIGPLIAFFFLTYLFMMYTNGVGASTGAADATRYDAHQYQHVVYVAQACLCRRWRWAQLAAASWGVS